ncbi:transcriptional regulator with XRE-family HTH domain [Geodermatophilus bullaregiensis]|uniref:helix-turn-helix domain-containing protein n=1 Tax=Geodermatophilus bullaregiensis TaxID=1564160 RepID=UPI00195B7F17|nr:helix-turn-helix transcriptional regulator [Geodermatophilus bullaregiensis]MBM7804197.1 transcriptional regulator with XRE-family HTH domain [Geodermatophilus bullaregiensis]
MAANEEPDSRDDGLLWLAQRLRSIRATQGIDLAVAAERSGVSYPYLAQLERGVGKQPTLSTLDAIARGYGLLLTELLDGVYPYGTRQRPQRRPVQVPDRRSLRSRQP